MKQANLESALEGIRHLLSHLHGEITTLEGQYQRVLEALRRVEKKQDRDDLTGLLRRTEFFLKWKELLELCENVGEACGIMIVDVDFFKQVNDTHGHLTGDEVLKRISGVLKEYESPNCIVGRFGGEEFVVGLKSSHANSLATAERIRQDVERLHGPVLDENGLPSKVEWRCTLSVGMASSHEHGYDAPRLLQAADKALYEAKRNGRNRVKVAS